MDNSYITSVLKKVKEISKGAGKIILEVYESDFDFSIKDDFSPLTKADQLANTYITKKLEEFNIPIISEENKQVSYMIRKSWEYCWIVDPLDGTKEFINKNGEFTVNIALIKDNLPILGVVYSPVKKWLYYADLNNGSYKEDLNFETPLIQKLPFEIDKECVVVVGSKSHLNSETSDYIESLKVKLDKKIEFISMGSSLKLCLVAEGKADYYPRLAPTMEWDTAAAHAIVKYAGRRVINNDSQEELHYNKENLLNPSFVVSK